MNESTQDDEAAASKEKEYQRLVEEVIRNRNLADVDRLEFYELHTKARQPNDNVLHNILLQKIREQKRFNLKYVLSESERKIIFNLLERKRTTQGLNRFEYRYYCFIAWRYDLPLQVGAPSFPEFIDISHKEFASKFGINEHRENLLKMFNAAIKRCFELYQINELTVRVGGSFVHFEKEMPGDIDLILFLDESTYTNDIRGTKSDSIVREFKSVDNSNLFDLVKLKIPLDSNHYMVYELMTLLSNSPTDRSDLGLKNNHFECRDLYQLTLHRDQFE